MSAQRRIMASSGSLSRHREFSTLSRRSHRVPTPPHLIEFQPFHISESFHISENSPPSISHKVPLPSISYKVPLPSISHKVPLHISQSSPTFHISQSKKPVPISEIVHTSLSQRDLPFLKFLSKFPTSPYLREFSF